jgi:hypothetical protein
MDNVYVLTPTGSGPGEATRLYPMRYRVSFGFGDVFACPSAERKDFQAGTCALVGVATHANMALHVCAAHATHGWARLGS